MINLYGYAYLGIYNYNDFMAMKLCMYNYVLSQLHSNIIISYILNIKITAEIIGCKHYYMYVYGLQALIKTMTTCFRGCNLRDFEYHVYSHIFI